MIKYELRYIKNLIKLHALICQDEDDERGDAVRDDMDICWNHLGEDIQKYMRELSSFLYKFNIEEK